MNKTTLELKSLACIRQDRLLFENLNVKIPSGHLLLIEGENGSGKTSLLKIIASLLLPTEGEILWEGQHISKVHEQYFQQVLHIGHHVAVKMNMTAYENVKFQLCLHRGYPDHDIDSALNHMGLAEYKNHLAFHLSSGQLRRIALSRLLLEKAKLWLLDEPFAGLDQQAILYVEELIFEHVEAQGIVVMTSHQPLHQTEIPMIRVKLS